ncbi:MAG: NCS2 family permease, partial [Gammaproteobacteria bacterium]|nr:NCS2 family permease [Gammaproteobacteria bacterium]
YAVAPALLYVGILMVKNVVDLNVRDFSEFMPSIVTAIMIPFSFSIADGFGLGLISYILFKLFSGRYKTLNLTLIFLGLIFIAYFMLRPQL